MKRVIGLIFIIVALLLLAGCGDGQGMSLSEAFDTFHEAQAALPDAEIVSYWVAQSTYNGRDVIAIVYEWSHDNSGSVSFENHISALVYQNGMRLTTFSFINEIPGMSTDSANSPRTAIQSGHTQQVHMAYSLNDTTSPITVQLGLRTGMSTSITINIAGAGTVTPPVQDTPPPIGNQTDGDAGFVGTWLLESSSTYEVFQTAATVKFFADGRGTSSCAGGFSWQLTAPDFPGPDVLWIMFDEHLHISFEIMDYPIVNQLHLEGWAWGQQYEYVFNRVN